MPGSSPDATEDATKYDFMVVSNRLPVDRCAADEPGDDGSAGGAPPAAWSPHSLPMMTKTDGAWVGWHGAPDETVEPFSHGGMDLVPVQLSTRRRRALLRRLLQRHAVAALPRRHRPAGVPPHLVGRLPQGQPEVRRRRRPVTRPRAPPSGCRTTSSSWCRGCSARRGRT